MHGECMIHDNAVGTHCLVKFTVGLYMYVHADISITLIHVHYTYTCTYYTISDQKTT